MSKAAEYGAFFVPILKKRLFEIDFKIIAFDVGVKATVCNTHQAERFLQPCVHGIEHFWCPDFTLASLLGLRSFLLRLWLLLRALLSMMLWPLWAFRSRSRLWCSSSFDRFRSSRMRTEACVPGEPSRTTIRMSGIRT